MITKRLIRCTPGSHATPLFQEGFLEGGVLQWVFEGGRVLRRVRRWGSQKGLSRRHIEGRSTPFRRVQPPSRALYLVESLLAQRTENGEWDLSWLDLHLGRSKMFALNRSRTLENKGLGRKLGHPKKADPTMTDVIPHSRPSDVPEIVISNLQWCKKTDQLGFPEVF